jgi:hypothetical protein
MRLGERMTSMRSIALLTVAGAALGLLSVAAAAEGPAGSTGTSQMSLKRIYQPDPKMMVTTPGASSLTPGAERRGLQTVDPAGPATEQAVRPQNPDTPAAAAAAVTTDASRMTADRAAQTIRIPSR